MLARQLHGLLTANALPIIPVVRRDCNDLRLMVFAEEGLEIRAEDGYRRYGFCGPSNVIDVTWFSQLTGCIVTLSVEEHQSVM